MSNVDRLEKELDQIRIGSMKLFVNIPRYGRAEVDPKRKVRRSYKNEVVMKKVESVKKKSKEV